MDDGTLEKISKKEALDMSRQLEKLGVLLGASKIWVAFQTQFLL